MLQLKSEGINTAYFFIITYYTKKVNELMKTIEEVYVKQIYNEIADQFNNTRVYTWSWIRNFINKVPKNDLMFSLISKRRINSSPPPTEKRQVSKILPK